MRCQQIQRNEKSFFPPWKVVEGDSLSSHSRTTLPERATQKEKDRTLAP